jgi:Uma2 family endonuclease
MVAAVPLTFAVEPSITPEGVDQRFVMYGVPWDMYVALNDALGDRPGVRVCYLEGTLELMSPGRLHEDKKTLTARLLEMWAFVRDVPLYGTGSMTVRKKPKERGAEPDESYFIGRMGKDGEPADLAIEVAVSRSAIDKLSLYAGLGVRELWIWQDNAIRVFCLGKAGYREAKRSRVLPTLDMEEMITFVRMDDQVAAVKAYHRRLTKGRR